MDLYPTMLSLTHLETTSYKCNGPSIFRFANKRMCNDT